MLFVGKNKVILGSDVRLVRVFQGIWIGRSGVVWGAPGCSGAPPGRWGFGAGMPRYLYNFLVFVGKNKVILGSMCVWCGYAEVSGYFFCFL